MNTKDLDYFHQLILQKNFSKVANFFNVSQPTITTALKRLETDFNTKLMIRDRVHNELTPTASGEQLAEHAEIILRQLNIAHQEIHNLTQQQIVLGLPPIIENHYFPKIAAKLADNELLASIQTVEGGSIALREAVRNGRVDMALLGSVEPLPSPIRPCWQKNSTDNPLAFLSHATIHWLTASGCTLVNFGMKILCSSRVTLFTTTRSTN